MTISAFPPSLVLILGALLLPFAGQRLRPALILTLPLVALWLVWRVEDGPALMAPFLDYELVPLQGDRLSRLFATIFTIMAFAGGLFALNRNKVIELVAAFIYAGSAVGVSMAGDLITVFVFWEVMAVSTDVP